jgi:hypothetical protein
MKYACRVLAIVSVILSLYTSMILPPGVAQEARKRTEISPKPRLDDADHEADTLNAMERQKLNDAARDDWYRELHIRQPVAVPFEKENEIYHHHQQKSCDEPRYSSSDDCKREFR